jgi:hypothetical protein
MSQPSPRPGIDAPVDQNSLDDSLNGLDEPRRKRRLFSGVRGLIVLNVVLLLVLGTIILAPQTIAQLGSRTTYALISSHVNGMQTDVVFILDTTSSEMIAISYNPQTNSIERLGYRRLSSDGTRTR